MEEPVCTRCGSHPHTSYHPWCRPCLNEGQNERRAKRREEGDSRPCNRCGSHPRAYGTTLCVECSRQAARTYYVTNLEKERHRSRAKYRHVHDTALQGHGDQCDWCGATEDLHLHHINGDGDEHRARCGNFTNTYRDMIRRGFPVDVITVCATCHRRDTMDHGAGHGAV